MIASPPSFTPWFKIHEFHKCCNSFRFHQNKKNYFIPDVIYSCLPLQSSPKFLVRQSKITIQKQLLYLLQRCNTNRHWNIPISTDSPAPSSQHNPTPPPSNPHGNKGHFSLHQAEVREKSHVCLVQQMTFKASKRDGSKIFTTRKQ